jgi:hypothetical protein
MKKYIEAVVFAALVGAAASPLACGSKSSGSFDQGDGGGDDSGKLGATSSSGGSSGGTSSGGSGGSSGAFSQGDSGGMGTGVCKTGTYSGPFSCGFYFDPDSGTTAPVDGGAADGGITQITGTLSFLLTQSTSGGEIGTDIASGTFAISAGLFITGMATLGGTLDCSTGSFTGSLTGGTYSVFFGLFTGTFNGPLSSDYNGKTASFVNGGWSLTIPGEGYCQGAWNADYAGVGDAGDQ